MIFDRDEREPEQHDSGSALEDAEAAALDDSGDDSPPIPRVEPPEVDVPEVEVPEVEVPGVEIPEVETSHSEVPRDLKVGFWSLVLVLNAAILALSLAPMLLYFRGEVFYAGVLFVGGVVLLAFAVRRYRTLRSTEFDVPDGDVPTDGSNDGPARPDDGPQPEQ